MRHDGTRRTLLPRLVLSQTCEADSPEAIPRFILLDGNTIEYSYRPLSSLPLSERESRTSSYNHVPVVIDSDGRPWAHAAIHLIDIIESAGQPANGIDSAQPIATDLADYKRFLELTSLDYLNIPENKQKRPPYRYRAYLMAQVNAGEIKRTVARRRIGSVIAFYINLKNHKIIPQDAMIWDERDAYIDTPNRNGRRRIHVKTTDLAIAVPKNKEPAIAEHIIDGGKLRPLPYEEQVALFDLVIKSKNTEMKLIILVMMVSAGRLQTVLTLRTRDFLDAELTEMQDVRIPVGPHTNTDTKGDRNRVLHMPGWLYRLLRIYAMSERAAKRREKAGQSLQESYLFISNRGRPYFESKRDRSTYNPNNEAGQANKGAAVQNFFREQLVPVLQAKFGSRFTLRPHDLKATAGLNRWEGLMIQVEQNKISLNQARDRLKEFMWHVQSETTDRYLNFKSNQLMYFDIQSRFERYLSEQIETANNGDWSEDEKGKVQRSAGAGR